MEWIKYITFFLIFLAAIVIISAGIINRKIAIIAIIVAILATVIPWTGCEETIDNFTEQPPKK